MSTRETVAVALQTLLNTATFSIPFGAAGSNTWVTSSRRIQLFGDVPANQQPALFLVAHDEEDKHQGRGIPVARTIPYSAVCYCRAEKEDPIVGDTYLNAMLDAIETALAPVGPDTPRNVQTLGGLVYKAWIKGRIFRDPGDLDFQAMLIVPIEVVLP